MKFLRYFTLILLLFTFVLPCGVYAEEPEAFQWDMPRESLLASLWEADIETIREALDLRLITCAELTEYYLERIDAYNETYNCFITMCDDALAQAEACDAAMEAGTAEGSLFGIPMVIKDNMDYAGYHTTNGYAKRSSQIADSNAVVVQYLLDEGAVIIGKTNMSTAAQNARSSSSAAAGETKNAYNSYLASGGSSGGSAVATSLNFAVAGLGTDTNSSLRLPAALNGCVSLRVTWDTLSVKGIKKLNGTRDVPGAITRTVKDQAILLDVLSGGQTNYAENLNSEILSGLRIGVLKEMANRSQSRQDDEVAAAFANAVEELKVCGAEVVEVSIPNVLSLAEITWGSNQASLKENMYNVIKKAMEKNQVAALIFPTYLHTPQYSGRDADGKYWSTNSQSFINNTSQFSSCASLPEIAIPIGQHSRGAGIGMEIAALKNQEQLLLDIAYAYSERYDHRIEPVNAQDLYAENYAGTLSEMIADYRWDRAAYEVAQYPAYEAEKLAAMGETRPPEEEVTTEPETVTEPETTTEPEPVMEQADTPNTMVIVCIASISLCLLLAAVLLGRAICKSRRRGKFEKPRQRRRENSVKDVDSETPITPEL